eukprot:CAMPEP_0170633812 /NCGR_PEP_ID=MMETSP0224-20130122/36224_1 /TAXON_ID=285029 /ORGANISM="Togula jolla, Strain CCCM 725" /LENGTH=478 /DNA_ID=CAMNT_0010962943 /DNA_START=232 /DNA_END=1668 /DNA_ORIENTATION=+
MLVGEGPASGSPIAASFSHAGATPKYPVNSGSLKAAVTTPAPASPECGKQPRSAIEDTPPPRSPMRSPGQCQRASTETAGNSSTSSCSGGTSAFSSSTSAPSQRQDVVVAPRSSRDSAARRHDTPCDKHLDAAKLGAAGGQLRHLERSPATAWVSPGLKESDLKPAAGTSGKSCPETPTSERATSRGSAISSSMSDFGSPMSLMYREPLRQELRSPPPATERRRPSEGSRSLTPRRKPGKCFTQLYSDAIDRKQRLRDRRDKTMNEESAQIRQTRSEMERVRQRTRAKYQDPRPFEAREEEFRRIYAERRQELQRQALHEKRLSQKSELEECTFHPKTIPLPRRARSSLCSRRSSEGRTSERSRNPRGRLEHDSSQRPREAEQARCGAQAGLRKQPDDALLMALAASAAQADGGVLQGSEIQKVVEFLTHQEAGFDYLMQMVDMAMERRRQGKGDDRQALKHQARVWFLKAWAARLSI